MTSTIEQPQAPRALAPPQQYEQGTILTLRMEGHSRSPVPGESYFAPAIVLNQFDNQTGDIAVMVWDSSAGAHYGVYHVREVSSRGDGNEREMYESQNKVGQVLFSPQTFENMIDSIIQLQRIVGELQADLLTVRTVSDVPITNATGTTAKQPPDRADAKK